MEHTKLETTGSKRTDFIVCGTGHRPNKLGGYSPKIIAKTIATAHIWLDCNRPVRVISGMAQGWDIALALAAIKLRIPLTCAIPFEGQQNPWPLEDRKRFDKVIFSADTVKVISPGPYAAWKMEVRNKWMVDNSDIILALYNGDFKGGTANCIKYAKLKNRQIFNMWEYFTTLNDAY